MYLHHVQSKPFSNTSGKITCKTIHYILVPQLVDLVKPGILAITPSYSSSSITWSLSNPHRDIACQSSGRHNTAFSNTSMKRSLHPRRIRESAPVGAHKVRRVNPNGQHTIERRVDRSRSSIRYDDTYTPTQVRSLKSRIWYHFFGDVYNQQRF